MQLSPPSNGRKSWLRNRLPTKPPWWPHTPHFRQALALWRHEAAPDLLYGGAAGGGKSDYLLMAASQFCHLPSYRALLIRKTYRDLSRPGALLDRARAWWERQHGIRYDPTQHRFTWPSGAVIEFGHLDSQSDHLEYQGAELHFVGFDEATQIPALQLQYLHSRLRRQADSGIPPRYRLATNPGGPSHEWVKAEFVTGADDVRRVFVPALLADNPYLDQQDYRTRLANLDPITRRQLEEGDWDAAFSTGFFETEQITQRVAAHADTRWVRGWDLAATPAGENHPDPDWTVGIRMGRTPMGEFVIDCRDVRRLRQGPGQVKAVVRETAGNDGAAVEQFFELEPGSSGKAQADDYVTSMPQFPVRFIRLTGDKVERAKPLAAAIANGRVFCLGEMPGDLAAELRAFPEGSHDDQVDALSLAYGQLAAPQGVEIVL